MVILVVVVAGNVLVSGNGGRYVGPDVLPTTECGLGDKFGFNAFKTLLLRPLGVDGRGRNVETGILASDLPCSNNCYDYRKLLVLYFMLVFELTRGSSISALKLCSSKGSSGELDAPSDISAISALTTDRIPARNTTTL